MSVEPGFARRGAVNGRCCLHRHRHPACPSSPALRSRQTALPGKASCCGWGGAAEGAPAAGLAVNPWQESWNTLGPSGPPAMNSVDEWPPRSNLRVDLRRACREGHAENVDLGRSHGE